jgi:hypothetical protein
MRDEAEGVSPRDLEAQQRRLWLLERLMEKMEPEEALLLAERMEKFIATGSAARSS